jgi:hypothetical protein
VLAAILPFVADEAVVSVTDRETLHRRREFLRPGDVAAVAPRIAPAGVDEEVERRLPLEAERRSVSRDPLDRPPPGAVTSAPPATTSSGAPHSLQNFAPAGF